MSDRVQGINRDDGLKVSRLRATEPARRMEGWEREAKGREQDRSVSAWSQKASLRPDSTETTEAQVDSHHSNVDANLPLETVTISLERYERLKQQAEQWQQLSSELQSLCTYSLIKVRGKERPLYRVELDRQALAKWLEILNQNRFEVANIDWKQGGNG